jgi:hypothetical protein
MRAQGLSETGFMKRAVACFVDDQIAWIRREFFTNLPVAGVAHHCADGLEPRSPFGEEARVGVVGL